MQKKLVLVAGLTANLVVPIAYIFGVTLVMQFWYEPVEAQHILVGLALVAALPIAGGSTAWAQNSNGNLALSLGLVLFSTILSPIVTPVTLLVFGEMAADAYEAVLESLAAYGSSTFLGLWVVLPSLRPLDSLDRSGSVADRGDAPSQTRQLPRFAAVELLERRRVSAAGHC